MKWFLSWVTLMLVPSAALADAQTIAKQFEHIEDGRVRMAFESRDGVCGNGRGTISMGRDRHGYTRIGRSFTNYYNDDDWWRDCEEGPVRVYLRIRKSEITRVRTYVGGDWYEDEQIVDLGMVDPQDAADFLLSLASQRKVGEDVILPAVLARGVVVWPRFLEIARDESIDDGTRKSAVFWLGQAAGEKATAGLTELVDDDDVEMEVRKSAVFALSQQNNSSSVRQLVVIAKTNRHPQLRKQALFWLAQSDDPRVLDVFEDILTD